MLLLNKGHWQNENDLLKYFVHEFYLRIHRAHQIGNDEFVVVLLLNQIQCDEYRRFQRNGRDFVNYVYQYF